METTKPVSIDDQKRMAASIAIQFLHSGMTLGLGTGSTIAHFIELLGLKLKSGELRDISIVPTSENTARSAENIGLKITSLSAVAVLDLAIDGADEVDPSLNLIKGLGRALFREKLVELHSRRFVVIVDQTKLVDRLGVKSPLPVEIVPFEAHTHVRELNTLDLRAELWLNPDHSPVLTDNGNYLALCYFDHLQPAGIADPYLLAQQIKSRTGIVEHGLFLDMADQVLVAHTEGVKILERSS